MDVSKRRFLQSLGASAAIGIAPRGAAQTPMPALEGTRAAAGTDAGPVTLNVNGRPYALSLEPRVTLLDALRDYVGLTGTKKGCDRGQCGACTVLVNGRRINSCLALAIAHQEDEITTIEGVAGAGELSAVQAAFVELDGFQCGYCTPGQIMSATALIGEAQSGAASAVTANLRDVKPVALTDEEIRERMSGNICRCGAYTNIVAAVKKASGAA